jgi:diguanylate cyclase (GGDEF)-like protein
VEILIAEDDRISRRMLQKALEDWGYSVLIAENGLTAWEIFQTGTVKFVIADWLMPGLDGLELCRKVRGFAESSYVYFLLLTGKDRKEDIVEGLNAGADDYVTKPFDREELRVRVRAGERILNLERALLEKNERLLVLNQQLEALASTDPLMDIGNRRSFYETIEKIHHRACRYNHIYGVLMIDVDYFKAYNDRYGHVSGDAILRQIASAIKSALRRSDEIFRYGGEEIVVILPDQALDGTRISAERVVQQVRALCLVHQSSDKRQVTISCGVAIFDRASDANSAWTNIIDRADKALYQAKLSGRDRVGL